MNRAVNEEVAWLTSEIRKVADASPVKLFVAVQTTSDSKFFWPYKLYPASAADLRPKLCDSWILDSDIFDPTMTNEHIIAAEERARPDWVVPKDYLGDMDRTVESIRMFYEAYKSREGGRAELLIPLQPPYVKCYEMVRRFGDYFAIGSVRNPDMSVDWTKTRRGILDMLRTDCPRMHLFGVSFPDKIIDLVQEERIVSCDSRAWLVAAQNALYRTFDGRQVPLGKPRGTMTHISTSQRALASLIDQSIALANPEKNGLGRVAWWKLTEDNS